MPGVCLCVSRIPAATVLSSTPVRSHRPACNDIEVLQQRLLWCVSPNPRCLARHGPVKSRRCSSHSSQTSTPSPDGNPTPIAPTQTEDLKPGDGSQIPPSSYFASRLCGRDYQPPDRSSETLRIVVVAVVECMLTLQPAGQPVQLPTRIHSAMCIPCLNNPVEVYGGSGLLSRALVVPIVCSLSSHLLFAVSVNVSPFCQRQMKV